MKKVSSEQAKILKNSDTSSLLEYSIQLNDKDIDFCINTITEGIQKKVIVVMKNVRRFAIF